MTLVDRLQDVNTYDVGRHTSLAACRHIGWCILTLHYLFSPTSCANWWRRWLTTTRRITCQCVIEKLLNISLSMSYQRNISSRFSRNSEETEFCNVEFGTKEIFIAILSVDFIWLRYVVRYVGRDIPKQMLCREIRCFETTYIGFTKPGFMFRSM